MPKGAKPKEGVLPPEKLIEKIDALAAEMGMEEKPAQPTTEELIVAKRREMAEKTAARVAAEKAAKKS